MQTEQKQYDYILSEWEPGWDEDGVIISILGYCRYDMEEIPEDFDDEDGTKCITGTVEYVEDCFGKGWRWHFEDSDGDVAGSGFCKKKNHAIRSVTRAAHRWIQTPPED